MKKIALSLGLLLVVGLYSCRDTSQVNNAEDIVGEDTTVVEVPDATIPDKAEVESSDANTAEVTPEGFPFAVSTFTFNQLSEADEGGCGMSLWRAGESPRTDGILLFGGVDGIALMMFDDEFQRLDRTDASGEEFYGQQSQQTFETADGATTVRVDVALGEPGEIESVEISGGTLAVETQGITTEIPVEGDAGC